MLWGINTDSEIEMLAKQSIILNELHKSNLRGSHTNINYRLDPFSQFIL